MALPAIIPAVFLDAEGALRTAKGVLNQVFVKHANVDGKPVPFESKLTPIFDKDSMLQVHDNTKILTSLVNHYVAANLKNMTSFDQILSIFNSDANLIAKEKSRDSKSPVFLKEDVKYFDFTQSDAAKAEAVSAVKSWLSTEFIPNANLRKLTGLDDPDIIDGMVSFTGAQIQNALTLVSKDTERRGVINLAIIKYPDVAHQYFTVYEITLEAWVERTLVAGGARAEYKNGLHGTVNTYTFGTKEKGIAELKSATKEKMIAAYDNFVKGVQTELAKQPEPEPELEPAVGDDE